jgi:hypothetical protein
MADAVVNRDTPRGSDTTVPKRAIELLRYFVRHPDNAESLEGMVRWRLAEETIHRSVAEIDEALHWLVQQGLLVERSTLGTDAMFSINESRMSDAKTLLEDTAEKPE